VDDSTTASVDGSTTSSTDLLFVVFFDLLAETIVSFLQIFLLVFLPFQENICIFNL
jgi:hypothetical protein